jgi:hypothetical protein
MDQKRGARPTAIIYLFETHAVTNDPFTAKAILNSRSPSAFAAVSKKSSPIALQSIILYKKEHVYIFCVFRVRNFFHCQVARQ